jgi:hypothetical protein
MPDEDEKYVKKYSGNSNKRVLRRIFGPKRDDVSRGVDKTTQ